MKRSAYFFGALIGLAILAAITYGFYLLHPGLGWIVGGILGLGFILRYSPEARSKREVSKRAVQEGALSPNEARATIHRFEDRPRGVN